MSCGGGNNYSPQIKELDSLQVELDKAVAVFKTVDTNKLKTCVGKYDENVKWIGENIKDTLSIEYLNALKNYRTINEPLVFVKANYVDMLGDASYSIEQLKKLAIDMKENNIDPEKAFEYYTIEKNEAIKLMQSLNDNKQLAKESLDTFEKYNGEIEKLIALRRNEMAK